MAIEPTKCTVICDWLFTLGPGQGSFKSIPDPELWFSVVIQALPDTALTAGNVTFGSMFQDGSTQYYPIANHGFKTVEFGSIPSKSTSTPTKAVVDFFGQCATGKFGVINNTDASIQFNVNARYRVIEDKDTK